MKWMSLLVLALMAAACGGATPVSDSDCADPETVAERVRFESIVVKGVVTDWDGTTAQFTIEEIWRGPDLPEKVEIVPLEGRAFTTGERYLVFPTDNPSPLADAPCSATTRWDESLAEYRPATARVPGVAPAEDADLPWEWVLALAALAAGFLGTRRLIERRRHPEPEWNPDFRFDDSD
ncbi:MAG: hypothetical protein GY720_21600 [bacterium]|nr:hypothetical protein [bacterium]